MTVAGICMVKDEWDIIAATLTHMAEEVDFLVVADNGSTDGTREILHAELADQLELTLLDDPDPAYYQSAKMSRLAGLAAEMGAEWIVPFDADELWFAEDRVSTVLASLPCSLAFASLTNHFATAVDVEDPNPFRSLVWRQAEPATLPKVAFRWEPGAVIHQGNHGVTLPSNPAGVNILQIRHFPYRSAEQFIRKARNGAAAYAATDLPESEGAHWRAYGGILDRLGEEGLAQVFRQHFWYLSPTDSGMIHDPAPYLRWQS